MRGGTPHVFPPEPNAEIRPKEPSVKWECTVCGERFAIRSSAPSCRIAMLREVDALFARYADLADGPFSSPLKLAAVDGAMRKVLHWKAPDRRYNLERYQQWRAWRGS